MPIRSMPSPRGTNREKLYILRGGRGASNPRMAYDSADGNHMGYGAAEGLPTAGGGAETIGKLVAWVTDNMNPADMRMLIEALQNIEGQAMDEPPTFPRSGVAQDGRSRATSPSRASAEGFAKRFPNAARIGVV
jgi:hypothetical protein